MGVKVFASDLGGGGEPEAPWADAYRDTRGQDSDEDAIANPLPGWSFTNSGVLASATHNVGGTGELHMVADGQGNWWNGTHTAAAYTKTISPGRLIGGGFLFARVACSDANQDQEGISLVVLDSTDDTLLHRVSLQIQSLSPKVRCGTEDWPSSNVGITAGQMSTGVWLAMFFTPGGVVHAYDLTDSATPPHERAYNGWTYFTAGGLRAYEWTGPAVRVGFLVNAYNLPAANHTAKVLHFDDTRLYADTDEVNTAPCFGVS